MRNRFCRSLLQCGMTQVDTTKIAIRLTHNHEQAECWKVAKWRMNEDLQTDLTGLNSSYNYNKKILFGHNLPRLVENSKGIYRKEIFGLVVKEDYRKEHLSWIIYVTLQCIATQSFLSWGRHCSILFRLCLPSHTSLELIWYFLNRPMGSDDSRLTRNTGYCGNRSPCSNWDFREN